MGFLIVANPASGSGGDGVAERAAERLDGATVAYLEEGTDLEGVVSRALARGDVVVAAGGDGTISAVVQHVAGRGTFGVLPGGTRNHFARDLGLDDEEVAIAALEAGETARVDLGRVNGRWFVNNVGLGLYPELVRERERGREPLGRTLATMAAALRAIQHANPVVAVIEADGDARALVAWVVFFGNNRFDAPAEERAHRYRLDGGVLDVRLVLAGTASFRRARLAWKVIRDRAWRGRRAVRRPARRVVVRLPGEGRLVSRDGELEGPETRLEVEIVPRALELVVPPDHRE